MGGGWAGGFPGGRRGGGGVRIGGRYPNGETLGLPTGLNLKPASLLDLLGLSPAASGTQCDFGVCVPIGDGFVAVDPVTVTIGLEEILRGIAAWGLLYQILHPPRSDQLPLPLPPVPTIDPICIEGYKADMAECLLKHPHDLKKREACYKQAAENLQRCINRLPPGPPLP